MAKKKAVVLLSGGLDSATVLAMAIDQGYQCHTLSFDYGQRHRSELKASQRLSPMLGAECHKQANVDVSIFAGSALTDDSIDVPTEVSDSIPSTYVPARNTVFLSIALAYAESISASDIFIGANEVDYSGYPDCRPAYLDAFESMANLAIKAAVEGEKVTIHAPLLYMKKSEIITTGDKLDVDYAETVSCYQADEQGRACGQCDSCYYRMRGFMEAGVKDATHYQVT